MENTKRYSSYDKRVQEYMNNIINYLTKEYKSIPEPWYLSLDIIAMNIDGIIQIKDDIEKNGIIKRDPFGNITKTNSLQLLQQIQNSLFKLLTYFGLTASAKSKIKKGSVATIGISDLIN